MNSSSFSSDAEALNLTLNSLFILYVFIVVVSLPLNIYVVWLIKTGAGAGTASEYFVLNLCVCEIILCFAVVPGMVNIKMYGRFTTSPFYNLLSFMFSLHMIPRPLFQCCICVERYVAVVHPVVYLRCKPRRYRIAFLTVAWSLVLAFTSLCTFLPYRSVYFYVVLPQYLIYVSVKVFCSVAVLRALRKPGPGTQQTDSESEANRMKKKAFWVILILLIFMIITYGPVMIYMILYDTLSDLQRWDGITMFCYLMVVAGIVQPFLYLLRFGKLPFIHRLRNCIGRTG